MKKNKFLFLILLQMFLGSLILINSTTRPDSNTLMTYTKSETICYSKSSKNVTLLWKNYTGNSINSVDISADGKYIVSGGNQNVTFFNRTHGYLWNYTCDGVVNEVAISSDGQYIVSGDSNETITLLNRSGTFLGSYKAGDNVSTVDISSNGAFIVAGALDGEVLLFSTAGDTLNYMWKYNTCSSVFSVEISGQGEAFISGSENNFTLFSTMYGGMYFAHNDSVANITSIAIAETGRCAIAGSSGSSVVRFFDFTNMTHMVHPWWTHDVNAPVTCVDVAGIGLYPIVGNTNNVTRLYGYGGKYKWHYSTGVVRSVKISDNEQYIVAGDANNNITYTSSNRFLFNYTASTPISSVAISSNGLYFAAGDEEGYVYLGYNEVEAPLPDPLPLILGMELVTGPPSIYPLIIIVIGIAVAVISIYIYVRKED